MLLPISISESLDRHNYPLRLFLVILLNPAGHQKHLDEGDQSGDERPKEQGIDNPQSNIPKVVVMTSEPAQE